MASKLKSFFKHIEHIGTAEALPPSQNVPPAPQFEPFDSVKAEIFRHRKQVGVNLGCVFCLEGWLAPPNLKSTGNWESEIEFLEACKPRETARDLLEQHWKSHITEKDFEFLASTGINAVRLPIGYWVAADRDDLSGPFKKYRGVYDAAWNYFLIMIHNAAKHNIGVLVDLHGAPGGQNCDSHCGAPGSHAQLFKLGSHNQSLTLKILKKLATTLAPINNVIGLEVLNEPQDDSALSSFYQEAIWAIREASSNVCLPVYLGDAWNVEKYSEFIAKHQDQFDFCVLDTHQYFCHMPADHAKTAEQHTKHLQTGLKDKLVSAARRIRGSLVVGEWAVVLNGKSIPKGQHDGDVMRDFGHAQLGVWDAACAGQFYWTYKTADDKWYWSYIYCHNNKILPENMGGFVAARGDPQGLAGQQDGSAQSAKQEHVNYWQQQKNGQAVVDNAWRFEQGYKTGYQVALRFLESQSRVGFVGQLAHEYAMQHLAQSQEDKDAAKANAWQFEHGFMQAVLAVNQQLT